MKMNCSRPFSALSQKANILVTANVLSPIVWLLRETEAPFVKTLLGSADSLRNESTILRPCTRG